MSMRAHGSSLMLCGLLFALAGCSPSPDARSSQSSEPVPAIAAETKPETGTESAAMPLDSPLSEGRRWVLQTASDPAIADAAGKAEIYIEVRQGRLGGYSGCNQFNAPFTVDAQGGLKVEPAVSTKRACVDDSMNQAEQRFLSALSSLDRLELVGDVLSLSGPGDFRLQFRAGTDAPKE